MSAVAGVPQARGYGAGRSFVWASLSLSLSPSGKLPKNALACARALPSERWIDWHGLVFEWCEVLCYHKVSLSIHRPTDGIREAHHGKAAVYEANVKALKRNTDKGNRDVAEKVRHTEVLE